MAGPPALRHLLLGLALAELIAAGAWGAVTRVPLRSVAPPTTTTSLSPGPTSTVPSLGPNQARISGNITTMTAGGATGPSVPTPLLIQVPVRGRGGAVIYNAQVGGKNATISWNGGEPMGITGNGALVPGRVTVSVNAQGATWSLDGAERLFAPGTYNIGAPVAVYTGGAFAQPEDGATFTAGPTTVLVSSGGASVAKGVQTLHLVGPGTLQLNGTLSVTTRSGTTQATKFALTSGTFVIDVGLPTAAGLPVSGVVQGATQLTP